MRRSVKYGFMAALCVWYLAVYLLLTHKPPPKPLDPESLAMGLKMIDIEQDIAGQLGESRALFEQFLATKAELETNETLVLPILVLACNRPEYLETTLTNLIKYSAVEYLPAGVTIEIIVSQDCNDTSVTRMIQKYADHTSLHLQQPDQSKISIMEKNAMLIGYYQLSRHYKWALSKVFEQYDVIVIVEDDLSVSPDFYELMIAGLRLMRTDPTIWCVSAWNDNGMTGWIANEPEKLYRTDFFPGLGWMLQKSTWLELEPKWPKAYWDDWMRHPDQRKDRVCLRPEVPRTSTFGKIGTSKGQLYELYLKHIKHYDDFVPFTKLNLSYLLPERFSAEFVIAAYSAPLVTISSLVSNEDLPAASAYRLQYNGQDDYKRQAAQLGLVSDVKAGVPRTSFHGIVPFMHAKRRVYLTPPSDWKGYDTSWS